MKIMVNGEQFEMGQSLTVAELLQARKVESPEMVAVEINQEILAQETYPTTLLKENDTVEVLYFMGGGSGRYERDRTQI